MVVDNFTMTNPTVTIKSLSLVSLLISVFVVVGAIVEIKQSQKQRHLPPSDEEITDDTLILDDISLHN